MKNKFKKIVTTTLLSAVSASVIGSTATALMNKGFSENQASAINAHTSNQANTYIAPSKRIGKIVETNSIVPYNVFRDVNNYDYLTQTSNEDIEENISALPSEISGSFHIFFLTNSPETTLSSGSENIQTNNAYGLQNANYNKINTLITKKSILMVYMNELNSNNVNLSNEDKTEIKNIISSYKSASGSRTATPYFKQNIDNEISAIDSIISIIESKLSPNSTYYQNKLTTTNNNENSNVTVINETSSNSDVANYIVSSFELSALPTSNSNRNTLSTNNTSSVVTPTENTDISNQRTRTIQNQTNQNQTVQNNISPRTATNNTNNTSQNENNTTTDNENNNITNSTNIRQNTENRTVVNRRRFRNNNQNTVSEQNNSLSNQVNQTTQNQDFQTANNNQTNSSVRRNNMTDTNNTVSENRVSRANRTRNTLRNEEYTPSTNTLISERHTASRVPYTDNFQA